MRSILFSIFLGLFVAACSSDSNDLEGSTSNLGSTSGANSETNLRVSTLTVERAGRPDSIIEHEYDSAGRIVTIHRPSLNPNHEPLISTITYGTSGVQTRTHGGATQIFNYDNERVSQIMYDTFDDTINYTYDNSGKLIGIIGHAFPGEGACEGIVDNDAEIPVFEIAYIGDQLTSITGSNGAVTNFEYNQQGLLVRRTRTEDCFNEDNRYITEYTYRADGLPLTETLSHFDSRTGSVTEQEEQVASYTDGQLTQLVETSRHNGLDRDATTTDFSYGANGRLETVTVVDEYLSGELAGSTSVEFTLTYGYEEGSCVEQLSAYPQILISANLTNTPAQANFNLHCSFFLDGF